MKIKSGALMDMDAIQERIVDHGRWFVTYQVVVAIDGRFYAGQYRVAATELQQTDRDDDIELVEVHQVEKTVKVWENK